MTTLGKYEFHISTGDTDDPFEDSGSYFQIVNTRRGYDRKPSSSDARMVDLYYYEHGDIILSTTPFNDRWDSGFYGFAYIPREKIGEEFGVSRPRQSTLVKRVESFLPEYNSWLNGEVWEAFDLEEECWTVLYGVEELEKFIKEEIAPEGDIDSLVKEVLNIY